VSSRGPSDSATASTSCEIEENESCSLATIERSWGVRELRMEMVSPAENSWGVSTGRKGRGRDEAMLC
jgi:hypothetical protein